MGSHRSQPDKTKHTVVKETNNLKIGVSHMCGTKQINAGWRIYMEDAHICNQMFTDKNLGLFGVFDGHGGAEVAVFVERHFAKRLQLNKNFIDQNYKLALEETFLQMDQLLLSEPGKKQITQIQLEMREKENGSKIQQQSHAGCTANVCLITPTHIYVANAGDSRAVACVQGKCVPLSTDHKPQDKNESERITKAGGTVTWGRVNGNLNLSRALGDMQYKTNVSLKPSEQMITAFPQVSKIQNKNVDFILMGCDGIWQSKSSQEMVAWVYKTLNFSQDIQKTVEQVLEQLIAKDKGGQYGMDNMSIILIQFKKQQL